MTTEVLNIVVREDGARVVKRNIEDIGGAASKTEVGIGLLKKALASLAVLGITASIGAAVDLAGRFETKMAEVSTLVDTTTFKMNALTAAIKAQSVEFGALPVDQAAAAYQIISAGASDAAKAIEILDASNRLAVGGVTDVATAADGLTSVLNAYGSKVEGATAVSDALFIGMRAGKTTIGELSAGLGKVAPLAAQTGVSFDELVAATSALTKGGISTQESITGVRAILAAVAKPTSEASKYAKQLGLDFSVAAIESKGFGGFLDDVVAKTGGSTDALAQLFGGVEALVPALALAGQAGADFDQIMADMAEKGGTTQEAFEKMTNTFEFQRARLQAGLTVALTELGTVITTFLTPALKFLADNFEAIQRFVIVFASALAVLLVPALASVTAGFITMAAAFLLTPFGAVLAVITALSAAVAYFGDTQVTVAGRTVTVWQVITAAVATAIDVFNDVRAALAGMFNDGLAAGSSFFSTITTWLSDFVGNWGITLDDIGSFIKTAINSYIGFYVGGIKAIGAIVTQGIPAAFALAMGLAKNIVIEAIQFIAQKVAFAIGSIAEALSALPGVDDNLGINTYNNVNSIGQGLNDLKADTDALSASFSNAGASINEAFNSGQKDYVGAVTSAVTSAGTALKDRFVANLDAATSGTEDLGTTADTTATALAGTTAATEALGTAANGGGGGGGGAAKATSDLNKQLEIQKSLLDNSVGARQEFITSVQAIKALLADPGSGFTQGDAFSAISSLIGEEVLAGTQAAVQAQLEQFQYMYEQIDLLRQQDLISEQTAAQAKAAIDAQYTETRLSGQRAFFGELAKLSRSGNRTIAAIGKAAAVTQATIDGYLAIQKALASQPPPWNYALAAAIGATTAANVASILSSNTNFATGGSFVIPPGGGIDSQMVALRASPGERVTVQTPTQVRHGTNAANAGQGDGGSAPQVNQRIINVIDPSMVGDFLATPEGEDVLVNTINRSGILSRSGG